MLISGKIRGFSTLWLKFGAFKWRGFSSDTPLYDSTDLEKLIVTQLLKTCTGFYGTRRFISVFTGSHHGSLSEAKRFRSNIIFLSTPRSPT